MLKPKRLALLILSVALASSACATGMSGNSDDFGSAVADSAAERSITITSSTRYVNVVNGQTVKFILGGQSFTWHFDTWPSISVIDFARIAPANVQTGAIKVYVEPSPRYLGT
ncbi:MAG: CzcE family metal-binding protein [Massilia sp.]